jgi:hypothetical protein
LEISPKLQALVEILQECGFVTSEDAKGGLITFHKVLTMLLLGEEETPLQACSSRHRVLLFAQLKVLANLESLLILLS